MQRVPGLVGVLACVALATGCRQPTAVRESTPAHIVVYVHAGGENPVAGIRVELVETGESRSTGKDGRVDFAVPPGDYVVRVHDLAGPGPWLHVQEVKAPVRSGDSILIRVFDCLMCD